MKKLYKRVTPIGCPGVRLAVGFCPLPPTRSLRSPAICNRRLSCPRSQNPAFSPLVAAVLLIHLTLFPASFSKFGLGTASNSAHSRSVSNLGLRIWVLGKPGGTQSSHLLEYLSIDYILDECCAEAHCAYWISSFQ